MTFGAVACNDKYFAGFTIKAHHPVAAEIRPIERAVRTDEHAIGLVEFGGFAGLAIRRGPLMAGPNHGNDAFGGGTGARRQCQRNARANDPAACETMLHCGFPVLATASRSRFAPARCGAS